MFPPDLALSISSLPIHQQIRGLILTVGIRDIVDILIVAVILYQLYKMIEGTSAITLAKGIVILLLVTATASILQLHVIFWLLQKVVTVLMVALPIIFQPELRRALGNIGQGSFFTSTDILNEEDTSLILEQLEKAIMQMSAKHIGALIIFERGVGLKDIYDYDKAVKIDALITDHLMRTIFFINTPLHDGAIIIRNNRIAEASCHIHSLTNQPYSSELGTRHRAAISVSEKSDAIVIVVSEETGIVSAAENGHLDRSLNGKTLREKYLNRIFTPDKNSIKFKLQSFGESLQKFNTRAKRFFRGGGDGK